MEGPEVPASLMSPRRETSTWDWKRGENKDGEEASWCGPCRPWKWALNLSSCRILSKREAKYSLVFFIKCKKVNEKTRCQLLLCPYKNVQENKLNLSKHVCLYEQGKTYGRTHTNMLVLAKIHLWELCGQDGIFHL